MTGGTGLGLSIVKHGAALHHAEIEMQSALGEGTTITLRFPKYNHNNDPRRLSLRGVLCLWDIVFILCPAAGIVEDVVISRRVVRLVADDVVVVGAHCQIACPICLVLYPFSWLMICEIVGARIARPLSCWIRSRIWTWFGMTTLLSTKTHG